MQVSVIHKEIERDAYESVRELLISQKASVDDKDTMGQTGNPFSPPLFIPNEMRIYSSTCVCLKRDIPNDDAVMCL